MVRLLAVDLEQGWTLSADSRDTLRSLIHSVDDLSRNGIMSCRSTLNSKSILRNISQICY